MALCALGRESTGMISNVCNQWTCWLHLISSFLVFSRNWQVPLALLLCPTELSAMLLGWDPDYSSYLQCGVVAFPAAVMCRLLPLISCGEAVLPRKGKPNICVIIRQVPRTGFSYLPCSRAYWAVPACERFLYWKKFLKTPSSRWFFSSKCCVFCCSLFAWWICCKRRALHM